MKQKQKKLNKDMDERIAAVRQKCRRKASALPYCTARRRTLTVQLEGSIAGSTAQLLGFTNIAAGSMPLENNSTAAPYSLETLVAANPILLHYQHGQAGNRAGRHAEKHQRKPGMAKPGGSAQRACLLFAAGAVFVKPRLKYPQAAEYMAKLAYPEKFE